MKIQDKQKLVADVTFLRSLNVGDAVNVTVDGKALELTVQRSYRLSDGQYGAWDTGSVTVGYGPGRWNFEVTPQSLHRYPIVLQ